MKNKKWRGLLIFVLLMAVLGVARMGLNGAWKEVDDYLTAQSFVNQFDLAIRPKSLTVTMIEDTHGGFHNDGDSLYKFDLNGQRPIVEGEQWTELPVDPYIISQANYSDAFGDWNLLDSIDWNRDGGGKWQLLPRSEHWMNWSLCVYDELNGCFYLYERDL